MGQAVTDMHVIGDLNVIQYRQFGEQADILERSRHAHLGDLIGFFPVNQFAVEIDFSFCRHIHTGNHIEGGGLAGAVRSDKPYQFPFVNMHGEIGNGPQTAEHDGNIPQVQ